MDFETTGKVVAGFALMLLATVVGGVTAHKTMLPGTAAAQPPSKCERAGGYLLQRSAFYSETTAYWGVRVDGGCILRGRIYAHRDGHYFVPPPATVPENLK